MERQSASSPDAGQERVMAAAKHIVKSLAVSKNAADDMMHFLSTFDPRLHPPSSPETGDEASDSGPDDAPGRGGDGEEEEEEEEEIAAAEEVIRRCNSSSSSSETIGMMDYLYAVDDAIAAAGHSARAAAAVHAASSASTATRAPAHSAPGRRLIILSGLAKQTTRTWVSTAAAAGR